MTAKTPAFALPWLLLLASTCGTDIPSEATWFGEVQAISNGNCVRCHGALPVGGAPDYFRLDRYDEAVTMGPSMVERAVDYEELQLAQMPPDSHLSAEDKQILARWVDNGMPRGTRDNHSPVAERIEPAELPAAVDQELSIRFRSSDEDNDGLIAALGYRVTGSPDEVTVFAGLDDVPGGTVDAVLDTGSVPSMQRIDIVAILDDGFSDNPAENKTEVILVPDLLIDHGERGTAPSVLLVSPNGGTTLQGETAITWEAFDPDAGDVLTIDLDLVKVDSAGAEIASEAIATGLPNTPSSLLWDPSGVTETGPSVFYRVRVSATDSGAQNTRSDLSDEHFTIAQEGGSTGYTWNDLEPFFLTYCVSCHGQPALNPSLESFRLDKYDMTDAGGDLGVYEKRFEIYDEVITTGQMPKGTGVKPSEAEKAMLGEWILAGAPF